ncbi:MAG: monofunctional biosynthetic peptidoglycan transglycosylase [Bacteroidia bacterium]
MNKTIKAIFKKLNQLKVFILKLIMSAFQISLMLIILYRVFPVYITPLPVIRLFEQFGSNKELRLKKDWVSIDNLGDNICKAAIVSEDLRFFSHFGFDFEQIYESIKNWFNKGKKLRGASTISQQTAKNLFFSPKRSWIRKFLEAYITICIEVFWNKKRILEVYLNIIEMGDGIYGAEAAAEYYFDKPAIKLTKHEAAIIVACFPNPRRWSPNKSSIFTRRKQAVILRYIDTVHLPW